MLVAAKCLAQEASVEEALICTREIRALAGRRSALPGGSSGVTSTVTHEAFKLEVCREVTPVQLPSRKRGGS